MVAWLEKLAENAHVEALILADDKGRVVFTTGSQQNERIASMLQAAEVIAQALTEELKLGAVEDLRLTTANGHLLLYPLNGSTYYLVLMTVRDVPLMLVMTEVRRAVAVLTAADFIEFEEQNGVRTAEPLDADELIQAVSDWLRQRPGRHSKWIS